jgi:hypothetical protein
MRRSVLCLLMASLVLTGISSAAKAYDPAFGFAFGYSLGQANQFRNQLGAPPYFAIYPPVYYGDRYERPYGESPFASWPLLSSGPDYRPRTANAPVYYSNPHARNAGPCVEAVPPMTQNDKPNTGSFVTVQNPYVTNSASVASR